MKKKLAVIGVGNMAKAIIHGIEIGNVDIDRIYLYDKNQEQYASFNNRRIDYVYSSSIEDAILNADYVLLSVKPQNFSEIIADIKSSPVHTEKLYITIAAGVSSEYVSNELSAKVVRVLPNLPMTIGKGVSVICRAENVSAKEFDFIRSVFDASGSTIIIDECEMNRIIGVTSSSPAYVFKFIESIYEGALAQGLSDNGLIDAICDVFIGSAMLLKDSKLSPKELISRVASKGGTTERALSKMKNENIDNIIASAMIACTDRANELDPTLDKK